MNPARSSIECPQEASVVKAARTGQWDDVLEAHAAACPACGEAALVSNSLRAIALETEGHKPLPDPYLVWLKASLTERQAASQRASKPWDLAEALGHCIVAVVLAGWLLGEWPSIQQRLAEWMPLGRLQEWPPAWFMMSSAVSFPPSMVFWTIIGLICFVALMAAEPLFSED